VALAALVISVATCAWTVAWSIYEFRQSSRREIRVHAWLGMTAGPAGKEGIDTVDLSAVNTGRVPITLRVANVRIIGDRQLPLTNWMHQEPRPLGSRAVVHPGETWVGLIDANALVADVKRVTKAPPPWQVVFAVTDADDNRYELPEREAIKLVPA
jgi:hypothetical protein